MVGRVNTGGGIKFANVSEMIGTAKSNILKNDMVYVKRKYLNTDGGQATLDIVPTNVTSCEFSPDGKYLAICTYYTPFIYIYKINPLNNAFTKLPDPVSLPTSNIGVLCAGNLVFSKDSKYMCFTNASAPWINIYSIDSTTDTFTKLPNVNIFPTETQIKNVALSADGIYLAILTYAYITLYKRTGTQFNKLYQYTVTHAYKIIHMIKDNKIMTSGYYNDILSYTDSAITLLYTVSGSDSDIQKSYVSDDGNYNISGCVNGSFTSNPYAVRNTNTYTADDNICTLAGYITSYDTSVPA